MSMLFVVLVYVIYYLTSINQWLTHSEHKHIKVQTHKKYWVNTYQNRTNVLFRFLFKQMGSKLDNRFLTGEKLCSISERGKLGKEKKWFGVRVY